MAQVTGATIKQMASDIFDYEISDATADALAHTTGSILTLSQRLGSLGLLGIEPPFGYPNLNAEASRLRGKKD